MGDVSKILVAGYGTSRIKLDENVIHLVNSLHVPDLYCNLFSASKHGQMRKGFSFLLEDSNFHFSLPKHFHYTIHS